MVRGGITERATFRDNGRLRAGLFSARREAVRGQHVSDCGHGGSRGTSGVVGSNGLRELASVLLTDFEGHLLGLFGSEHLERSLEQGDEQRVTTGGAVEVEIFINDAVHLGRAPHAAAAQFVAGDVSRSDQAFEVVANDVRVDLAVLRQVVGGGAGVFSKK